MLLDGGVTVVVTRRIRPGMAAACEAWMQGVTAVSTTCSIHVSITCLLYGADPARYAKLMAGQKIPPDRLAKCKRDYPLRKKAWDTMLAPHQRKKLHD
ncbi:MAG: hypothetical protein H0T79_12780 [Deltaproteobacteria bacterium]|nr:hypothetical protein [Deltaproteobacteria bacterium]